MNGYIEDFFKYTICFIKRGEEVLLLNREKPGWMGCWNGVGGRIEEGETPRECILREVFEETGIKLDDVTDKGIVTWEVDGVMEGGMHIYLAELKDNFVFDTPKKMEEGILDWKKLSWIYHPENVGVAENIPTFLPIMISKDNRYEHFCIWENGKMQSIELKEISSLS
jgi:8-oxo-dGTP diphosphatase